MDTLPLRPLLVVFPAARRGATTPPLPPPRCLPRRSHRRRQWRNPRAAAASSTPPSTNGEPHFSAPPWALHFEAWRKGDFFSYSAVWDAMGSEPKEMKYRRRARVSEPGEYGQCRDRGGAVDWGGVLKQDPAELFRKLDEIRDQITRSCEIGGRQPRAERYLMNRRAVSLRPSHAEAPPPPPPRRAPEHHRSRHAARYGPGLPGSTYEQRSVCDDKYGRQQSGRFRQCQEGQWENYGYDQGNSHHTTCQCAQCVHGRRAVVQEEHIPMARYFAGQQGSYLFERAPSISSEYDRRSVASSLYSHRSMSKRRVEYFRKKAGNFCRPTKGAAPFIVCSSCNQLLQLPSEKCTLRKQNQFQCGSCSEVITFKLKEVKVHPLIPPSTFPAPKSVRTSRSRVSQSSGWYEHQDGDNPCFSKLQAHDSQRQNVDFADNISPSSTGSFVRTDKERGSNRSIQFKSGSASRSRFANSPKDILCQGDTDSKVEASVLGTNSPQTPILVDKLVDPFSSQRKHFSAMDQIASKECGLDRKSYYDSYVRGERIDMKCEEKSKEVCTKELGEEIINKTHEHNHKKDNAGTCEDGSMGNKRQKANYDDKICHEDEDMSKRSDERSKQCDCSFEYQGINKRYGKCNEEDNIDVLEVESKAKTCKQGNTEGDYSNLFSSNCENSNTQDKNESSMNERTNTSSVSSEANLDEIQSLAGKSGDSSFFAGFLKRGFKDLSLFNQSAGSVKVSINGHPISERALQKAEKKAGPVSPGSYWYDHRAGFWGVMGHECSGIIPPFIKEFNYSMPKNCAGGNTGVFVNGRELHQKDFDLLVKRGLPSTSGKSYSVEISGNVIDDTSGKKLRNLGKLAPTIEKMKRGFGMHIPEERS